MGLWSWGWSQQSSRPPCMGEECRSCHCPISARDRSHRPLYQKDLPASFQSWGRGWSTSELNLLPHPRWHISWISSGRAAQHLSLLRLPQWLYWRSNWPESRSSAKDTDSYDLGFGVCGSYCYLRIGSRFDIEVRLVNLSSLSIYHLPISIELTLFHLSISENDSMVIW